MPKLPGFAPVADIDATLVRVLKGIRPPARGEGPQRFRPYGGSVEWTKDIEATGEEDMGRWDLIAVSEKPVDFNAVGVQCAVEGLPTRIVPPYWLNQKGRGMEIGFQGYDEDVGLEEAVKLSLALGYVPTRKALARVAAI